MAVRRAGIATHIAAAEQQPSPRLPPASLAYRCRCRATYESARIFASDAAAVAEAEALLT